MSNVNPEDNKLYSEASDLHNRHWDKLAARDMEEAARSCGATLEGKVYRLAFLSEELLIDPAHRAIEVAGDPERRVGYQRALVAVAYLGSAIEAPVRGDWVGFRELPGGDSFFRGPHAVNTMMIETVFGLEPLKLVEAGDRMGWRVSDGGDAAVQIAALPLVPLKMVLWGGGEFKPKANLLTDGRVHLHLPLDVLWAITNLAVANLILGSKG